MAQLLIGVIFLKVLEKKEEKLPPFEVNATLLNLIVVCPPGRHHFFIHVAARPTLSCVIPALSQDASNKQVPLAH